MKVFAVSEWLPGCLIICSSQLKSILRTVFIIVSYITLTCTTTSLMIIIKVYILYRTVVMHKIKKFLFLHVLFMIIQNLLDYCVTKNKIQWEEPATAFIIVIKGNRAIRSWVFSVRSLSTHKYNSV